MGLVVLLIVFALIIWIDFVPLTRKSSGQGVWAFLTLFVPALVIALLEQRRIEVPSVMLFLGDVLKKIGIHY